MNCLYAFGTRQGAASNRGLISTLSGTVLSFGRPTITAPFAFRLCCTEHATCRSAMHHTSDIPNRSDTYQLTSEMMANITKTREDAHAHDKRP